MVAPFGGDWKGREGSGGDEMGSGSPSPFQHLLLPTAPAGWAGVFPRGCRARGWAATSRMTAQICLTHWMMVSGTPETVTARSVELGRRSPATCT